MLAGENIQYNTVLKYFPGWGKHKRNIKCKYSRKAFVALQRARRQRALSPNGGSFFQTMGSNDTVANTGSQQSRRILFIWAFLGI